MVFKKIVSVMCLVMCGGVLCAGEVTPPSTPRSCVPPIIVPIEYRVQLQKRLACSEELAQGLIDLYAQAHLYFCAQQEYIRSLELGDSVGAVLADRGCRQFPNKLQAAFECVAAEATEGTAAFNLISAVRRLLMPGRVLADSDQIDPVGKLHELYAA